MIWLISLSTTLENSQIRGLLGHHDARSGECGCFVTTRNADTPLGDTENGWISIKEPAWLSPGEP
jgi:hypothetical protein